MDNTYKLKIANFYRKHRRMPTYGEILSLTGFKSKNAVYKLVERLRDENFLDKDRRGFLVPRRLFGEIPFVGLVEAGFPSPAEDELGDTMSLDEYLISNKEATYLMRAKGDSMVDAGIVDGDMLLVERTDRAKPGAIVIALVDGERTMKYLRVRTGKYYLEPANDKFRPIVPKEELRIEAIVKAVIRKY